jgi:hypothetical protein
LSSRSRRVGDDFRACDIDATVALQKESAGRRSTIRNMKTIAISIDDETLQRLERASQGMGATNRSKLVREAVKDYLTRLEAAAGDERETLILRRRRARLARQAEAAVKAQARP